MYNICIYIYIYIIYIFRNICINIIFSRHYSCMYVERRERRVKKAKCQLFHIIFHIIIIYNIKSHIFSDK